MDDAWSDLEPRVPAGGSFQAWARLPARAASTHVKRRWSAAFSAWLLTESATHDDLHERLCEQSDLPCRASSLAFQCRALCHVRSTLHSMQSLGQTVVQLDVLRDEGVFVQVSEGETPLSFQQHFQFALQRLVETSVARWLEEIDCKLQSAEFGAVRPAQAETAVHEQRRRKLCETLVSLAVDHTSSAGERGMCVVQALAETGRKARCSGVQRMQAVCTMLDSARECVRAASALGEDASCDASLVAAVARSEWVQIAHARLEAADQIADFVECSDPRLCSVMRQLNIYLESHVFVCNLQTSLLQLVLDEADGLQSGLAAASSRARMLLASLQEGSLSPCGLAVSRQSSGCMPQLDHVRDAASDWSLFRTSELKASCTSRLEAVVHDCLLAGIFPSGAVGPSVLLQALSFAEREIKNEVRGHTIAFPAVSMRCARRAREPAVREKFADVLPMMAKKPAVADDSDEEAMVSCDGSHRSVEVAASEAAGRKRLDAFKTNPLLLTMVDRNIIATLRDHVAELPEDSFKGEEQVFEMSAAGLAQILTTSSPSMLVNKLPYPQEVCMRLVKRIAKRVHESFTASGKPELGRLEIYTLRTPTNRNSPRVVRVARGQVQWLCTELSRIERWLYDMPFQKIKTNWCKHHEHLMCDAVALVHARR
jgi:hypothetical protein